MEAWNSSTASTTRGGHRASSYCRRLPGETALGTPETRSGAAEDWNVRWLGLWRSAGEVRQLAVGREIIVQSEHRIKETH